MRIELIGPPGVGKSTLAPILANRLEAGIIDLSKRRSLSGQPLGSWARRMATFCGVIDNARLTAHLLLAQPRTFQALRSALGTGRRESLLRSLPQSRVFLVDEGPLQAVLWTLMFSRKKPRPDRLAAALSKPDVAVRIHAPTSLLASRVKDLGDRLLDGTAAEVVATLERYEAIADEILEELGVPVVTLDGFSADDVGVLADQVRSAR
jgi:hypothetical protein